MRLTTEQIEKLTTAILRRLQEKELIVLKTDEHTVLARMEKSFMDDFKAEDELDREVEKMMESHTDQIDTQRLDYRRMFNMIKNKLVRERGIVI
jgi:hypothetical protein